MAEPETPNRFVQALALGLDPAWRRQPADQRADDAERFGAALAQPEISTFTYSMVGMQPHTDLMLWRLAPSFDALEEAAAAALNAGLGRWLTVRESLLGIIQGSQYVKRPTAQEQSLFTGERSRYLIVYPFTKAAEWYLLGREARQGVMNEHIRVGHEYPQVRQLLANSFGIDDMDFLVAYETDDLATFSELVRALRGTESRRSTVRDTPILCGVHRSTSDLLRLLGA
jgi:chlorite dismutase